MSANETQVGGTHYKTGGEEHWDRVQRLGLDYFQGQITKYVERWKLKNGVEDLKKARHFLDKYIEISTQPTEGKLGQEEGPFGEPLSGEDPQKRAEQGRTKLFEAGDPVVAEREKWEREQPRFLSNEMFRNEGGYGDGTNLYTCLECKKLVRANTLKHAALTHQCAPKVLAPHQC